MKYLSCLALVVLAIALASEPARGVPDRKAPDVDSSRKYVTNSVGMKFVWIPPGHFIMGSPKDEPSRWASKETQHKVNLTKGFYMSVHLVTQEQWQAVMGDNPSHFKGEKNLPVDGVSWDRCQQFANKLQAKDGKPYRLPTDAEWEYACRAGTKRTYWFGNTVSTAQANFNGAGPFKGGGPRVDRKKTTPVDTFPANSWGLHDMHGNLWQWVQDMHGDFSDQEVTDPQGPTVQGSGRCFRGGSWDMDAATCRAAARGAGAQDHGFPFIGIRLVYFAE